MQISMAVVRILKNVGLHLLHLHSLTPSLSLPFFFIPSLSSKCLPVACSGGCHVGAVLFSGCHFLADLWESGRPE